MRACAKKRGSKREEQRTGDEECLANGVPHAASRLQPEECIKGEQEKAAVETTGLIHFFDKLAKLAPQKEV